MSTPPQSQIVTNLLKAVDKHVKAIEESKVEIDAVRDDLVEIKEIAPLIAADADRAAAAADRADKNQPIWFNTMSDFLADTDMSTMNTPIDTHILVRETGKTFKRVSTQGTETTTGGLGFVEVSQLGEFLFTPQKPDAVPAKAHNIFERITLPQFWGYDPDINIDAYPSIQAAVNRINRGQTLTLEERTYEISRTLDQPRVKIQGSGRDSILKLKGAVTNQTAVVKYKEDGASISDLALDASIPERQSAGLLTIANGSSTGADCIRIESVSDTKTTNVHLTGFGGSTLVDPMLGQWAGIRLTTDTTGVNQADCANNLIEGLYAIDADHRASFIVRIRSNFDYETEGVGPKTTGNTLRNFYGYGTAKDAIEVIGPNTCWNVIEDGVIEGARGAESFDIDFGAHHNFMRRLRARRINTRAWGSRGTSGFRSGTTDKSYVSDIVASGIPHIFNQPHDNLFEDCWLEDCDFEIPNDNTSFIRLWEDICGRRNRFVRGGMRNVRNLNSQGLVIGLNIAEAPNYGTKTYESESFDLLFEGVSFDNTTLDNLVRCTNGSPINRLVLKDIANFDAKAEMIYQSASSRLVRPRITNVRGRARRIMNNQHLSQHYIADCDITCFGSNTPLSLGRLSSNYAKQGVVRNNVFRYEMGVEATNATVFMTRELPDEVIESNVFDGLSPHGALVDDTRGRGYFSSNASINPSVDVQARVTPAELMGIAAPTKNIWGAGDIIKNRDPAAGGYMGWINTTLVALSAAYSATWTSGQTYSAGTWVYVNGVGVFEIITSGSGAVSIAPTNTSGDSTGADGYTWRFRAANRANFKQYGQIEA